MAAESYGKRPMWQWVLIYLVIAAVVYAAVYYIFFANKGGYSMTPSPESTTGQSSPPVDTSSTVPSSYIYQTSTDSIKGNYLSNIKGVTLYMFDKDTPGVSSCYDKCATTWPPYYAGATTKNPLQENITVIDRTDGTNQFAYKGMPLYYYATDTKAGDITGDGVGGVWHIIKL